MRLDRRTAVLTLALAAAVPLEGEAQSVRDPVAQDAVISVNPFLLLAEWFNVEFEHKTGERATLGLQASLVTLDAGAEEYQSVNAIYRYYPQGAALTGFYFGPRAGIFRVEDGLDEATVFGAGFELGYNWLLGADANFAIGLGIGASRLFGGDLDNDSAFLPTVRLINVGWAF